VTGKLKIIKSWGEGLILAMQEAGNEKILIPGQSGPKKKLQDPISTEKRWAWRCVPVIPAMMGSVKYEDYSVVHVNWGKKARP
jgi:hypothetical protein